MKSSKLDWRYSKNFWQTLLNSLDKRTKALINSINKIEKVKVSKNFLTGKKVLSIGSSKLYQFSDAGIPLLIVPSMINKAYILDLESGSFIKELKARGFKPYVIEWGNPLEAEFDMDLNDYCLKRLNEFAQHILNIEDSGLELSILGYCMGGIMALLYAIKFPKKIHSLTLLATPWDFNNKEFMRLPIGKLKPFMINHKVIKKEFFQLGFYLMKFSNINNRYIKFTDDSIFQQKFIEIESWLNDGIDMPKKLFEQFYETFVIDNGLMNISFKIGIKNYNIKNIKCPVLNIAGTFDSLVPFRSSSAISVSTSEVIQLPSSHIGLVSSNREQTVDALFKWHGQLNQKKH